MKFQKFIIEKYRAIDSIEVKLSNNLIPLIGINESGKTSILQAILCFDKLKDNYNKGQHLNYKNKFIVGKEPCFISAEVIIDSADDLEHISKKMKLTLDDELIKTLTKYKKNKTPLIIKRELENGKYSIENVEINENRNEKLANTIFEILPYILYFDDFSDRVPEEIKFKKSQINKVYRPGKSRAGEWQNLIQEIFYRSTNGKYALKEFINIDDDDDKSAVLSDVKGILNDEVIKDWKALKKRWKSYADDIEDLELQIKHNSKANDEKFIFEFKVIDKSAEKKSRFFNINERSKGFQWFFNFTIKLKFNSKYKDQPSGAIYLLDEPGSYLHSSAQEELLHELQKISKNNAILFCTHSQHLLDPDVINISSIKISTKEQGKILIKNFGSSGSINYEGALTPLYNALHLKIGSYTFEKKRVIITEGITDYYLFKLLQKHLKMIKSSKLVFIPGAGAGHLKELISFAITWAKKYLVLLDSDKAGKEAYKKYSNYFGNEESHNFYKYCLPSKEKDVKLEDFLSTNDKNRLFDITKSKDTKASIIKLYFMSNSEQEGFLFKLEDTTIKNFDCVIKRINQL